MWDLIVSVPDHCLSFYLVLSTVIIIFEKKKNKKKKTKKKNNKTEQKVNFNIGSKCLIDL